MSGRVYVACQETLNIGAGLGSRAVPSTSYWLAEPHDPPASRRLHGPPDVAVVGGGITGCSCALALAEAGLRVRLYEAREVAGGASGRNGGFALRGGAAPYPVMVESIGRDAAAGLWRWTEDSVDALAAVGGDAFRRSGSLRLAADDEERDELEAEYEALREDGFVVEWRDDLPQPLSVLYPAAIFHPPDGVLQPARLVRELAARAAEAGVEVREHTRVGSRAETGAETVVVATDGYPSGLLGELEGLIVPTRGQVLATEPVPERLFEIPHYGRHGFDYWHQAPDGRIVVGGFRDVSLQDEFTDEEVTTPAVQEALESFVGSLLGRRVAVEHRWAGIFGMVFDFLPVVGRVPGEDGLWVAGGYSGHGNVLGFACGRLVARAILGDRDPLLDLFEPGRLLADG
jgi:gamma-glutamylputrescine oxidase